MEYNHIFTMTKGEVLEMNVVRLESNEYGSRFILQYGDCNTYRVKAYDFQVEGDHSHTIKVRVASIDPFTGFPNLVQENNWVLEQTFGHYNLVGRNYEFEIIDIKVDPNTGRPYLLLKDEFGIRLHRFYTHDDYSVGDRIRLHIKEIKSGYLCLEKPQERTRIANGDGLVYTTKDVVTAYSQPSAVEARDTKESNTFIFKAEEGQNLEYKSSIAFDSRTSNLDIDKQMRKILKSIAGFMNADGGTLYIGVKDNGVVRGIEDDFQHLNTGSREVDEFSGQYRENVDGFENKIRNSVSQYLSSLAGALFEFNTESHNDKIVARIDVAKAYAPIYYNGHIVFQRQGNRTIALKDNMLTHFCASKWFGAGNAPQANDNNAQEKTSSRKVDEANDTRDYSVWHTLHLHENGGWSFDDIASGNSKLDKTVCSCEIEKYRVKERHQLLLTYESGNVNIVNLDKKPDWANLKGWGINGYRKQQKLQSVYCANPMDMIAVFYEKDNRSFAKVIDIERIGAHSCLNNNGNSVVPEGAKDCKIFHIHHKYHDTLRGLTRSQRNYAGYDVDNDSKVRPAIQKLQEIVREEYGVLFE